MRYALEFRGIGSTVNSAARALASTLLIAAVAACASSATDEAAMPAPAPPPVEAPAPEPAPPPVAVPPSEARDVSADDPRVGLEPGWHDAGQASEDMELVAHVDRPPGFFDPNALGNILLANSDIAFRDDLLFMGSFHGFNIYDISDAEPRLRTSFVCPGGQGDLSVYGDLLFMSVEMPNGRIDCGTDAPSETVSPERFRGVRIFDISDIASPVQIAAVQTCRGSHTHTLVTDPSDDENIYIYVQGTSAVRPAEELAGCSGLPPEEDPATALFRIEVIQVPLDSPEDARIVNAPRIFAEGGDIAGLFPGGTHGPGTQQTATTNQCHDITAYPEIGLAAGACSGNGILLDISDPAEPVRIDEVVDPNFAYWHSATFNNPATTVLFTDEWGGGVAPHCLATDDPRWGADAIFRLDDGELTLASYYKLPAPQTELENCVAHNGSLVPVPGRDIMVQAWYQGGASVFDFTDPENAFEIAFFDRGPMSANELLLGGFWSTYWYNGYIYGSEIGRGLDVFRLEPSEHLTQNEIDAARLVEMERFNPQTQTRVEWPAEFVVAYALLDQLARGSDVLSAGEVSDLRAQVERAEGLGTTERQNALNELATTAAEFEAEAAPESVDARRLRLLAETLTGLASR